MLHRVKPGPIPLGKTKVVASTGEEFSVGRKNRRKSRPHHKEGKAFRGKTAKPGLRRPQRNRLFDCLRGLAIVLMIADHVAWMFFDSLIEPGSVRMITRLAMPLFCVLSGYFVARTPDLNWMRMWQIAVAALVVNLFLYPVTESVEILCSLLVCFLCHWVVRGWFEWALLLFLLFQFDISIPLFDYPVSVVATCVAAGSIMRRHGDLAAIGSACTIGLLLLGLRITLEEFSVVTEPSVYVLLWLPIAVGLVAAGDRMPSRSFWPLEWIGRYPLSVYVTQYVLILWLGRGFQS